MTINISNVSLGTGPDTYTGEPLRTAFGKINNNFSNVKATVDTLTNGNTVFGNITANNITVTSNLMIPSHAGAPITANSVGESGRIMFDSNYIYVCVATNSWRRANLSSF